MIPVARTENLLLQDVGDELIIYDQKNNSSHCLTPIAVRVWELSTGQNTINDITKKLEKEFDLPSDSDVDMRGVVWLTLEELERYSLIKEYVKKPIEISSISRRKVIKTATLVGGMAIGSLFPMVKSIAIPDPGGNQSTGNPPPPAKLCKCTGIPPSPRNPVFCRKDDTGTTTGVGQCNTLENCTQEKGKGNSCTTTVSWECVLFDGKGFGFWTESSRTDNCP